LAERTIFKNAPITEALLDIRVELPPEVSLEHMSAIYDRVKESYPNKRERISWHTGVQFKPDVVPEFQPAQGGPDGYLLSSLDGRQIVQARLDGYTFNKLKPYDRWETFREEAKRIWQAYTNVGHPKKVIRLALRYINRIEIPLPMRDFKDYILTVPEIAPGVPQGLERFFMRLVIPSDEAQAVAVVTESMEPGTSNRTVPVIFDIDVIRQAAFTIDDPEIWNTFERLHDLKNEIFFRSITDKTKELFQ
jgi:uncharacterized protein (TIGR04255 family)